ncbi:MAG: flagellar protein FlgN [Lachnospiraceae bacterium]|nr:flagellar protein FlgN [Lachnospiraceae bacterium]
MASLMDDLKDVLQQENRQYQELIALSEEKCQVLVRGDVNRLEQITALEQQQTDVLHQYEMKRKSILKDMAEVLGKDPKTFTVEAMIRALASQPEEQNRLIELRDQLRITLHKMAEINTQNQALIKQALEMVEFDLTLFRSLRQAPETANYNKSAYNTGDLLGSGGFDAKQ